MYNFLTILQGNRNHLKMKILFLTQLGIFIIIYKNGILTWGLASEALPNLLTTFYASLVHDECYFVHLHFYWKYTQSFVK